MTAMKRYILSLFTILAAMAAISSCSTSKTDEERVLEYRVDSLAHVKADRALQHKHFVIMAERISLGRMGHMYNNPRRETNFVYVVDNDGVVQLAFDNGRIGLNGLGGVTVRGSVSKPRYKVDKKGNISYSYTIFGTGANAEVDIRLFAGSDDAQAYITSPYHSERMVIYGKVQPYNGN